MLPGILKRRRSDSGHSSEQPPWVIPFDSVGYVPGCALSHAEVWRWHSLQAAGLQEVAAAPLGATNVRSWVVLM